MDTFTRRLPGHVIFEPRNEILREVFVQRVLQGKRIPCVFSTSELDDVHYSIKISPETLNEFTVSIKVENFKELKRLGATERIQQLYGALGVAPRPEADYDLTLTGDLDNLPYEPEDFVKNMGELRKNIVGAPLYKAFSALLGGTSGGMKDFKYQVGHQTIFVSTLDDRVHVILSIDLEDPTDQLVAKLVLAEIEKQSTKVNRAASTSYYPEDPPREIGRGNPGSVPHNLGFMRFTILASHVDTDALMDRTISTIVTFRHFIQYHVKAKRTFLHMRMRSQTKQLLRVLNGAIQFEELETDTDIVL